MSHDKEYVIGALASEYSPPEEIKEDNCLVECSICKEKVWIMSWNLDKLPLCMPCLSKLPKDEEKEFGVTEQDEKTINNYIKNCIAKRKKTL